MPGIGLLTATAMVAATGGEVGHYRDARHFASWFGLTPRLARICHAVLKHHEPYGSPTRREESKKINRTAYAVAV